MSETGELLGSMVMAAVMHDASLFKTQLGGV